MQRIVFKPLETERLLLRMLTEADAEDYFRYLFGCPEVGKFMLWTPHGSVAESVGSIRKAQKAWELGTSCRWAITRKPDGQLLGIIDLLRFDWETQGCSFAYMLGLPFQGMGYGTEALAEVLDFAFRQLDLQWVTADHFAANTASGRAMEKAGMIRTRLLPGKYEKEGRLHDAVEYTVTRRQWLAGK